MYGCIPWPTTKPSFSVCLNLFNSLVIKVSCYFSFKLGTNNVIFFPLHPRTQHHKVTLTKIRLVLHGQPFKLGKYMHKLNVVASLALFRYLHIFAKMLNFISFLSFHKFHLFQIERVNSNKNGCVGITYQVGMNRLNIAS